jgi:5-methylcytosine-specific restriction enzyme A
MDLLAYWRWDNYLRDLDRGAGFHFNSNQSRLHSAVEPGDRVWCVTGYRPAGQQIRYALAAKLTITAKTINHPGYEYGRHRIWGDTSRSAYYAVSAQSDLASLLQKLEFEPRSSIADRAKIGQSLQTLRSLTPYDSNLLAAWANDLPLELRAYQVTDERDLETAYATSAEAVVRMVRETLLGVAPDRREFVVHTNYQRSRGLVSDLNRRYSGRCQLCAFSPRVVYGVSAAHAHHIVYLSRGGNDVLNNLVLLCPNHHDVIHAAQAHFDFGSLEYIFPNRRREPVVLNDPDHLQRRVA